MKSLTIHNLDNDLYTRLKNTALEQGTSMNKVVRKLLRTSLGLEPVPRKKIDFSMIAGKWTEEEAKEFEDNMAFFDSVSMNVSDEEDKS